MRTPLLFLPGAGGDPEFWKPLGDLLPREHPKTYLGWPGLGDQPARDDVQGFDDLVRLAEQQLRSEPVDVLAQSMGGAVALRLALRHPARIRRLVLAATSGGLDLTRFGAADWRPEYRRSFPNAAPWITEPVPDLATEVPQVKVPTLLLWGDADPISPVDVGRELQRLLPNASLHIVPGGDHGFVHDRAAEIASIVARHLT